MPNVGLLNAGDPIPPDTTISIRYTVEVGGLPVYTELYDVRKVAGDLTSDREKTVEAWNRRLEAPVMARDKPKFSELVTAHLHSGK
ncbi:MAG TPA: hypothetical protein VG796_21430 [Verrucomicrobiales bacterium]|jgi:hypothetical protein|nr:hypothetical protein [Verrucomicrobiales bacterium]